jgi:hypothetical protein
VALLLLVAAVLLALRPSRLDRRAVLGLYSIEYAALLACAFAVAAWWLGALLRPASAWGRAAGRSFRAAVGVASVALLTFAVAELTCRIVERPLSRYIGGPALARSYRALVHLNSRGLRDPERPLAKPPGTWRMVVLGDSYMFGQGVPEESTCVRHLERLLVRPGGPRVEVINTARTGYNTVNERAALDTLGLRFQPDLVLVGYLPNDPEQRNLTYPELLPGPFAVAMSWSVFYHTLRAATYYALVATGLRPDYTDYVRGLYRADAPGWRAHVEALHGIVADAAAAGVPVVMAMWPLPDRAHGFAPYPFAREQAIALREARAAGARVLDLLPVFAADRYEDFALSSWDEHPGPGAHRRAAAAIAAFLEREGLAPRAAAAGGAGRTAGREGR